MLDEIETKTMHNDKGDHRGKRSKTMSAIKQAENISRNLQSFLDLNPMQKEVLLSHKPCI